MSAGAALLAALLTVAFHFVEAAYADPFEEPKDTASDVTTPLIENLEAKLADIAERTDLAEAQRTKIENYYRAAIDARRQAEEYRLKGVYVEQLLAEVPTKQRALLTELDNPPVGFDRSRAVDASPREVTARIAELEAELHTQRTILGKIDGEISHRAERRTTLPRETSEAKLRADTLQETLRSLPMDSGEAGLANRARLEAQIAEQEAKAALHSQELFSYDGRRELLATRRDLAALRVARADAELAVWRNALAAQREAAGEAASQAALDARETARDVHPALKPLAAEVAKLAEERANDGGLTAKLTTIEQRLADVRAMAPALGKRFDDIRAKAAVVGYTNAIGALLRKERQELPEFQPGAARRRRSEIAETQYRMIELEEDRRAIGSIAASVDEIVARADGELSAVERVSLVQSARDLLTKKRDYIDDLIDDYDKYFLALVELDNAEKELAQDAMRYERYIDENVLWIRNAKPLSPTAVPDAIDAAIWLGHPRGWAGVASSFYRTATQQPVLVGLLTVLLALLFFYQSRLRRFIRDTGARARNPRDETPLDAVAILGATFLIAVAWPALMNVASYVLLAGHDEQSERLAVALAQGLAEVAAIWLSFEFLRQLCRKGGLAETHLGWSSARIEAIRLHAAWALPTGAVALLISLTLENQSEANWQNSLGRVAFIVAMIALATFANKMFSATPSASYGPSSLAEPRLGDTLGRFGAVFGPIMLAVLAAAGWYFSSLRLAGNVPATNWLIVTIIVADQLILRRLRLAELRLRREQARVALAEARKREERKTGDALVEQTEAVEELPDVAAVSAQTRQLVRAALGVLGVVGLVTIWGDVLPAFRLLDRFELWTVGDSVIITLSDLLLGLLFFGGAALAARNIPGFLEIVLLQRLPLDAGMRYTVRSIARYLIAITGTMFGFGALGLSWTDVQWLVAAMTVGLGFGLQEIFANFVSGIILLFERPIRVGDTVTLGTTTGTVSKIRTRATTITDFDRKELVVPNKEFITGQLVNWSLTDTILRVVIDVGVAYGSDVELTEAKLLEVAHECKIVLAEPEPSVVFNEFGASSLNFQLRVFIPRFDDWLRTRHELHKAIDAKFREADIEISFPQRDLHLRTVDGAIPVRIEPAT